MGAATISAIAEVVDAIPDGPYIVVESPFPALERIGGGDVNLGSTFGNINLPFGEDFLDVEVEDDNSTNVTILDVGPDAPEAPEAPETPESEGAESGTDADDSAAADEQPEVTVRTAEA